MIMIFIYWIYLPRQLPQISPYIISSFAQSQPQIIIPLLDNYLNIIDTITNKMLCRVLKQLTSNIKKFEVHEQLKKYLTRTKPNYLVVYFHAKWNPHCSQSDKDIEKLAANFPGLEVILVNSDLSPKIAKHYHINAQPQFVFCLYGDQLIRQIGVNYDKLVEKVNKMDEIAKQIDLSLFKQKWKQYGTAYNDYYNKYIVPSYQEDYSDL